MKLPFLKLNLKRYQRYLMAVVPIVVVIGTVLILSGVIYVVYTESYLGQLAKRVHAQTLLETILVALGYLVGLIGLVIAYMEFKRTPRGSEDLVLLGIILSFIAWLLIHNLYLWKRGP